MSSQPALSAPNTASPSANPSTLPSSAVDRAADTPDNMSQELGISKVIPPSTQVGHGIIHSQQFFGRNRAQRNDHFGLDDINLAHQKWRRPVSHSRFKMRAILGGGISDAPN